ncbi:hypothetical protein BV20DRAFT_1052461 [Pilatotrama ljubarskyi]|nr:hypothetical protein BV20DRAFT_1052461 [Pilatotrama ljubarskyi]
MSVLCPPPPYKQQMSRALSDSLSLEEADVANLEADPSGLQYRPMAKHGVRRIAPFSISANPLLYQHAGFQAGCYSVPDFTDCRRPAVQALKSQVAPDKLDAPLFEPPTPSARSAIDASRAAFKEYHKAIRRQKRQHWREYVGSATKRTIWQASKYVTQAPEDTLASRLPSLNLPNGSVFFPPPPPALLEDISNAQYGDQLPFSPFSGEDIAAAIDNLSPLKAPDPSGVPNAALKECAADIPLVFHPCLELGHPGHPAQWKFFTTITVCKSGQPSYLVPKAYRLIALEGIAGYRKALLSSPLPPVLYLFYSADLLEIFDVKGRQRLDLGYIDDTAMAVSSLDRFRYSTLALQIGEYLIHPDNYAKYLGVVDRCLRWRKHVEAAVAKASAALKAQGDGGHVSSRASLGAAALRQGHDSVLAATTILIPDCAAITTLTSQPDQPLFKLFLDQLHRIRRRSWPSLLIRIIWAPLRRDDHELPVLNTLTHLPTERAVLQRAFRSVLWSNGVPCRCHRLKGSGALGSSTTPYPSESVHKLYRGLSRRQCSILTQLRSSHVCLNVYLARIKAVDSALCTTCLSSLLS